MGIAILDVVHEVTAYPEEDSKIRSLETRKCRGGNVANALVTEPSSLAVGSAEWKFVFQPLAARWCVPSYTLGADGLGVSTDPAT
ncbi:hypothetical protein PF005_g8157 [Phytophthora fragariae]|uniref:Uncharacterized protein n=1 Tax=Phytophthora fragariae TaxID=53985 RepID=A0A6A3YH66_9STRA|nr:hypothetical protein PF003_g9923 [Phytophthora fragariae]KAE8941610.1 hypothetical protein PF009_g8618 [Phytophthora fragariae]KAE9018396.1 hypothetical protein PF011_g6277 [Phytophthora fragariae]KAE9119460.1 hypothetical protein PF007_g8528 [Phytophthora fragariae]KAE9120411.1 hypothetical protein PF010_g7491 [Phytophthora fragariae]